MAGSHRIMRQLPAIFCALFMGFFAIGELGAQKRFGPSPLNTLGKDPDQKVGWKALQEFRQLGISAAYQFSFELKVEPRLEDTRTVKGMMIGKPSEAGPLSRIDLTGEEGASGDSLRLLLQNGIFPTAWRISSESSGLVEVVDSKNYFDPIAGSDVSIFELLMPFQFWQRFYYEGRTELGRRPTHVFWMYPPEEDAELLKHTAGVRLFVNDQFHAMMKAEIFDADRKHIKTLTIRDFKKVDGTWVVVKVDVWNEVARENTRFKVTQAKVGIDLADHYFTPEALPESLGGKDLSE